jgi:O-methyltransferase involved in polyketide biosynthesis
VNKLAYDAGMHPRPAAPETSAHASAAGASLTTALGGHDPADELTALRTDFPGYRIWTETARNDLRYVARRQRPGLNPHTVVTDDLAELRAVLGGVPVQADEAGRGGHALVPNIARMYSRWTGGKDSLAADRAAADAVLADFPAVAKVAVANREFVARAVASAAAAGISQFIDIGTGLPAAPAIHQVARNADPGTRVAYVDNDPVVLAHARALLAGPGIAIVPGDLRQPTAILAALALRGVIDLDRPACLVLAAVLHFLTPAEADTAVGELTAALAPGSYLIISAGTCTGTDPDLISRLRAAYGDATVVTGRPEAEIAAYFDGLDMVPPGLTDVGAWRPGPAGYRPAEGARIIGAVARKPVTATAADEANSPVTRDRGAWLA